MRHATQEYSLICAVINEGYTSFDSEDVAFWNMAGLTTNACGDIQALYPREDGYWSERDECNSLLWLMAKLINFMAVGDDVPEEQGWPINGMSQRTILFRWRELHRMFDIWYSRLSKTFKTCGRLSEADDVIQEIWYPSPIGAATMQYYHMSRILLGINKPHESTQGRTTIHARLGSYQIALRETSSHAHRIVGIALAHQEPASRIHSIQPLYVAGQSLQAPEERQIIVDLLKTIEKEVGWPTDHRIGQLRSQWNAAQG